MELATMDLWYLLQEWKQLEGARIQKVYMKERLLVLQLYKQEQYQWLFSDGKSFLSTAKLEYPKQPHGFTMFLRKRIQGSRISSIELLGFDRILQLTIESKEGPLQLIIELFGSVNYLLCKDGKIISAFETHTYTDRTIRGGAQYVPPPSKPAPWEADLQPLLGQPAAKTLATALGIGGKYAEEACKRLGIPSKHELTEDDIHRLQQEFAELPRRALAPVHDHQEALPYEFATKMGNWVPGRTFNECIDSVEREALESVSMAAAVQKHVERKTKQERIITAQRKQLEQLHKLIEENQRKGELLWERYSELKPLLEQMQKDWKALSFKEVEAKYKDHPLIKRIEPDGTIEVDI